MIFDLKTFPDLPIEALNYDFDIKDLDFVQVFRMGWRGKKDKFDSEEEREAYL